jgi:choline dehydrogenase-like flavoprotein
VKGAIAQGVEMRVGPVGIVNGTFGNRPHRIYRGFYLQGRKVGAKASPYVAHLPDALAHGVEIRADRMAVCVEINDADGRASGVTYVREGDGVQRHQRARVVAVAGYSIETPRLLLHSTSKRFPGGLGNGEDQVGRNVMVQGASQSAGRFGEELRMYKGPPPEVSSEQSYETDEARGFPVRDQRRARAGRRPVQHSSVPMNPRASKSGSASSAGRMPGAPGSCWSMFAMTIRSSPSRADQDG